ncbi:uncharacterized protein LOC129613249 isoform X2 [Condylostylus longicornis]|uniref:uncharacterized protein LOC129613249 isoform X2 n=1 Tax=Condylostylus longicornis TaxID=2530218 RepID=UPI00244E2EFB|nr:uncharacterized protein LOC129613249 isoform X2 [Condylostylus longicornis]
MKRSFHQLKAKVEMPEDVFEDSFDCKKRIKESISESFDNEKLIEVMRDLPCLWDKSDLKYKDKKFKEEKWEEIADHFNTTVKICKLKWRNLRDRYLKEKRKSNTSSGNKFQSNSFWKYSDTLSFLDESILPTITINYVEMPEDASQYSFECENKIKGNMSGVFDNEKLIEIMRELPCLWDKTDAKYKNKKLKEEKWEEIAEHLNTTIKICKLKWRNLRDRYLKERRKSNTSSGSKYQSHNIWKYCDTMSFLDKSIFPPISTNNTEINEVVFEDNLDFENDNSSNLTPESSRKRTHSSTTDELINLIKRRLQEKEDYYNKSINNKYENFVNMVCELMDQIPDEKHTSIKMEVLNFLHSKIPEKFERNEFF